jgi:poly(A) polymerase
LLGIDQANVPKLQAEVSTKVNWEAVEIPASALQIVKSLRAAGFRSLLAGGCVRDLALGLEPKDFDIATDAPAEEVQQLFEHTIALGIAFGIITVVAGDGSQYEVARFRTDLGYVDGRHPSAVAFTDVVEEDARRRDFTINGMFLDPLEGRLIDHVGGKEDLGRGLVRAIGDPARRFDEDYLRMIRAIRLAAGLNFRIDQETLTAIANNAESVKSISAERVRDELTRMLTTPGGGRGLQWMMETGLMAAVLPEVAAMDGVPQPPEFHPEGDVWTHVRQMVELLQAPSPTLAWSILLHDIGKPVTYAVADRIRFDGHDAVGARMAEEICRRLRFSAADTSRIRTLTAQHMRIGHAPHMRLSKLKRFLREPFFTDLLELHRIDCLASHGKLDVHEFCQRQLDEVEPEQLHPPRLVTGDDLLELGLKPGPQFAHILSRVEEEQLEGRLHSREAALEWVAQSFTA